VNTIKDTDLETGRSPWIIYVGPMKLHELLNEENFSQMWSKEKKKEKQHYWL
jgi:hypothetical protein